MVDETEPRRYAMFGEDLVLAELLGPNGFLVDVGAYDGVEHSNSRWLLELGWTGVLFEPNPEIYPQLAQNSVGLAAWCMPFVVGPEDRDHCVFQVDVSTPGYSTAVGPWGGRRFVPITTRMIGIAHLLRGLPPVDMLTVDAEGLDTDIVAAMMLGPARPRAIVIEGQTIDDLEAQRRILAPDYEMVRFFSVDGTAPPGNSLWRRRAG